MNNSKYYFAKRNSNRVYLPIDIYNTPSYTLYHQSVVNAIMTVNPTGVRFISVEDWKD